MVKVSPNRRLGVKVLKGSCYGLNVLGGTMKIVSGTEQKGRLNVFPKRKGGLRRGGQGEMAGNSTAKLNAVVLLPSALDSSTG